MMVGSGVLVGRLVLQELLGQAGGDVDGLGRLAGYEPAADRDDLARCQCQDHEREWRQLQSHYLPRFPRFGDRDGSRFAKMTTNSIAIRTPNMGPVPAPCTTATMPPSTMAAAQR